MEREFNGLHAEDELEQADSAIESMPRISSQEEAFIRSIGGDFTGFVITEQGRRFRDIFVGKVAYFDERMPQRVAQQVVVTEAVNAEGLTEIRDPQEIEAYRISIDLFDRFGKEIVPRKQLLVRRWYKGSGSERISRKELRDEAYRYHSGLLYPHDTERFEEMLEEMNDLNQEFEVAVKKADK